MLAADEDVEARLGRTLTSEESERVDGLLEEASVLVEGWLRCTPDPVPSAVKVVVSRMVARALAAPAASEGETGMTSLQATMGVFQVNRGFSADATSGGVWLTRQDKIALRGARCSGRAGNVPTSKW